MVERAHHSPDEVPHRRRATRVEADLEPVEGLPMSRAASPSQQVFPAAGLRLAAHRR